MLVKHIETGHPKIVFLREDRSCKLPQGSINSTRVVTSLWKKERLVLRQHTKQAQHVYNNISKELSNTGFLDHGSFRFRSHEEQVSFAHKARELGLSVATPRFVSRRASLIEFYDGINLEQYIKAGKLDAV